MKAETIRSIVINVLVTFVILMISGAWRYNEGFRAGQIHALSGQSRYVLTTMPSGETRWAEKESK